MQCKIFVSLRNRFPPTTLGWAPYLALVGLLCHTASATVWTYPFQTNAGMNLSTEFTLKAGGKAVPVIHTHSYEYAHFSFNGSETVEITKLDSNIGSIGVSPKKFKVVPTKNGKTATFTVSFPQYWIIHIDNQPLVLLADPPENVPFTSKSRGVRDVTAGPYKADNTGKNYATDAFQRALNETEASGNGVVYVPAGVYKVGNLAIGSNTHFYLEGGAVLVFTGDPAVYKEWWTKYNDPYTYWIRTRMFSQNIKVSGRGTFFANGKVTFKKPSLGCTIFASMQTTNFVLEGLVLQESSAWNLHVIATHGGRVENVKVLNRFDMGENDGIDVDESDNVYVKNSIAITWDDAFSTKTYNFGGRPGNVYQHIQGNNQTNSNITFDGIVGWTGLYGLKVGQGVLQDQHDIVFKNAVIYDSSTCLGVDHRWGSATAYDLHWDNIECEHITVTVDKRRTWMAMNSVMGDTTRGVGPIGNVVVNQVKLYDMGTTAAELNGYSATVARMGAVNVANIYVVALGRYAQTADEAHLTKVSNAGPVNLQFPDGNGLKTLSVAS